MSGMSNEPQITIPKIPNISIPLVIETPGDDKPWAVSLGGFNPTAELCWECDNEDAAWRLHDAIYFLLMKDVGVSQSLLDQMARRTELWSEFGTLATTSNTPLMER